MFPISFTAIDESFWYLWSGTFLLLEEGDVDVLGNKLNKIHNSSEIQSSFDVIKRSLISKS
jgi:hypothetical protein